MKRSVSTETPVGEEQERVKAFRRQNPISCQFCRSKKLRCDRAQPCSNCVARNVTCIPSTGAVDAPAQLPSNPKSQFDLSIVESRLKALEQAVFKKPSVRESQQSPEAIEDGAISKTATWMEAAAGTLSAGTADANTIFDEGAPYYGENPPRGWISVLTLDPPRPLLPLTRSDIAFMLPLRSTAESLFEYYVKNLNWIYHIIHVPTVRQQLASMYTSLENRQKPRVADISLVVTILSVTAYFRAGSFQGATKEESTENSTKWGRLAQRALSEANHLTSPTIETLQATIIMTQFLPNYGQTTSFTATLAHSAHMLQLHKVDSARNRKFREENGYNAIELEVKRRIWWYIAGTDWLLSFMSGPQCGTYVCHPDQMNVDIPSNSDDAELTTTEAPNHPAEEITEMTYSIGKIYLANIIRELVDDASKQGLEVEEMTYDQVLNYDRKLSTAVESMPWFYRLDEANIQRAQQFEKERPYLAWQRNFIHFGYHTRLCRLHRPYLARGYKDPRYAYSRMICLRSARIVIEMEGKMHQQAGGFNPDSGRLWIVVHHVFVATVTLVMDYVCHRDDPQATERKQEIMNCYKILERSQEDSGIARRGLAHLRQVMKDWMIKSDAQVEKSVTSTQSSNASNLVKETANVYVPNVPIQGPTLYPSSVAIEQASAAYNNNTSWMGCEVAQDLWLDPVDFNNMQNDPQWEDLFRDLESQPGIYG